MRKTAPLSRPFLLRQKEGKRNKMAETVLNTEMTMVMAVLLLAIFLFITELVRVDVVAIIMMVILPLLGLVTPAEAFSGLSSNAVVSIIAVIMIGAGLDKTGIMNQVAAPVIKFGGTSVARLTAGISGTVAIISSFMQNIGAAALFLPATMRVSKQTNIPLSRLLMPMGFCAIMGGTVTLVGSSPLILLNDLLAQSNLPPFGLFSVTPIGILLVISGILYFLIFGKYVLPVRTGASGEEIGGALKILKVYGEGAQIFELKVPENFEHTGKTLEEFRFRRTFMVTVIAIAQSGVKKIAISPSRNNRLHPGDVLAVLGHDNNVEKLADHFGLVKKERIIVFAKVLSEVNVGLTEGIVGPRSSLIGKTIRQSQFINKYEISPVALYRDGKVFRAGLSDIPIDAGDALLLHGMWKSFAELKKSNTVIIPTLDHELFTTEKASAAVFSFGTALSLVIAKDIFDLPLSLSVCLMTGALLMVLTKVLSIDEAYKAVDWRTVFLLAGLIPLGIATEKSGTAAYIAAGVLNAIGDVSTLTLMTVIAILSTIFTLVISNVGATVLLVPLVINMAYGAGADPRMAALVVAIAVSNSFILPTHQVNALLMGPGRYTTKDYMRAGIGMSFIFIVVLILGLWAMYGI